MKSYSEDGKHYVEVVHEGLNKRRLISGRDYNAVVLKAQQQDATWEEEWSRQQDKHEQQAAKQKRLQDRQAEAEARTRDAQRMVEGMGTTLWRALGEDHCLQWDALENQRPFPERKPSEPARPSPPTGPKLPPEPVAATPVYVPPQLGLLDKLSASRRTARIREAREAHQTRIREAQRANQSAVSEWHRQVAALKSSWEVRMQEYQAGLVKMQLAHARAVAAWEQRCAAYEEERGKQHQVVDQMRQAYLAAEPSAIEAYYLEVFRQTSQAEGFPSDHQVQYSPETRMLVVDLALPRVGELPTLKQVKYVASKDEFTEAHMREADTNRLYDSLLYQIALRTAYQTYDADFVGAVDVVVLNGWVTSVDAATGQEATACVLSLQTTCEEFTALNLAEVDPKECFKKLKGVGSSKLHSLTPVAPVVRMSRDDARFVSSYGVADELDGTSNLAAMEWEDFEHLVREVFEKEFSQNGGEVKVTRASRDGGVDAVAFDPDPLRGGKIVIQAKRYTNTVGVSAVRDLYGTVLNEGATKGILVTTSDYGPDAYEFARDKPLTLLNGGELLYLLERHGHKARIDLKEAKLIQAEREKQQGR